MKIELTDISYINGERHDLDYDYRKKQFASHEDMERYRKYLEKRTGRQLFFTYREQINKVNTHKNETL